MPAVLDHLKETAVFVVPLRIGAGTRLKIFEAIELAAARMRGETAPDADALARAAEVVRG